MSTDDGRKRKESRVHGLGHQYTPLHSTVWSCCHTPGCYRSGSGVAGPPGTVCPACRQPTKELKRMPSPGDP